MKKWLILTCHLVKSLSPAAIGMDVLLLISFMASASPGRTGSSTNIRSNCSLKHRHELTPNLFKISNESQFLAKSFGQSRGASTMKINSYINM
jgi:hypothetical protein